MIEGFEKETAPLTDYERNVVLPIVVKGLRTKVGRDKAVTNAHICSKLKEQGYNVSEPRIRKIISHIRMQGLIGRLIATSQGYYICTNRAELSQYIESLRGREASIRAVRRALELQTI